MSKSYSMAEVAKVKFELPIGAIFSFQQLDGLIEARNIIRQLWKDHKKLWEYLEKIRIYALLIGKEKEWKEWKEKNKFSFVGFEKPEKLFKTFKFRLCAFCNNPFSKGGARRIYCSDTCKAYAYRERQAKKSTIIDKKK